MNSLHTYIPQDRYRVLLRGESLPDHTHGSALFADISGFTPLTERLTRELGPRRGAEELSSRLNLVYDALIGALEQYGGSVIGFAGDAITCWFDTNAEVRMENAEFSENSAFSIHHSAFASAFAMQTAMQAFPDLALKISIASGPARRFVVGDPQIQLLDTLAGATLARMADGEHLAQPGEILADEASLVAGGTVKEWRVEPNSGEKFAVISNWRLETLQLPIPNYQSKIPNLQSETLRPWLLPAVYEREMAGMGAFLTELRNTVALFLRFEGLDYDADPQVGQKLDDFIRRAQEIVTRNGGNLLAITIGDKGSYSYCAFGAPVAHENDSRRALNAALELREMAAGLPFITSFQIGLSRGTMRTGAYGGSTRRTYGVLGDEVNLAARLMQAAQPGQIVVGGRVQYAATGDFVFEAIPAIRVKGKAQPVTVFLLHDLARRKNYRLLDPSYALPMVGRQNELALIVEKMELAARGKGQIIGICAEAGLGKSRLVAEAIHLAQRRGFTGYGGACQSDGVNTAYLVWRAILRGFFDVDVDAPAEKQTKWLESTLESFAPQRLPALPLVAGAIGLTLPDNDFTHGLEPKDRKSALEAALVDCVRGAAEVAQLGKSALLFVLEDLHWLDALSHDLLEEVARASENLPVLFLLAYRPPETARLAAPRLEKLTHFTRLELASLSEDEAAQAIQAKLGQLFPEQPGELPTAIRQRLMERCQGNPFYLEELLNYLRDRSIDPRDETALAKIELPDSLHTLVLSRLDQLSEHEKTTLKVASVIGRLFRVVWINGYYPELGDYEPLKKTLEQLRWLEITPLDTPEPELAYLFKHLVTLEVTYESLPLATRALLHEQLARWLETTLPEPLPLDLLAFHYGQGNNLEKKREYLAKAGEYAKKTFANEAALAYYEQLLLLLEKASEKFEIHIKRGQVFELIGDWKNAETDYTAALDAASENLVKRPAAQFALGKLCRLRGDFAPALAWLEQAQAGYAMFDNRIGLAQVFIETGVVQSRQGEYDAAAKPLQAGLGLAREMGDDVGMALALNHLGTVTWYQGNPASAQKFYEESLILKRKIGDTPGIATLLNNIGLVLSDQGRNAEAQQFYDESMMIRRKIGDKWGLGLVLNNLGLLASDQGEYAKAQSLLEECLVLCRSIGDKWGVSSALSNLGIVIQNQGDYGTAQRLYEESLMLRREMGDQRGISSALDNLGCIAFSLGDYGTAQTLFSESLALAREIGDKHGITYVLNSLGNVTLAQDNYPMAQNYFNESLDLAREIEGSHEIANALTFLGFTALVQGDFGKAQPLFTESLILERDTGEKPQILNNLIGMTACLWHRGKKAKAVRLHKTTEKQLALLKIELDPVEKKVHQENYAMQQEYALTNKKLYQILKSNEQMELEKAIADALRK